MNFTDIREVNYVLRGGPLDGRKGRYQPGPMPDSMFFASEDNGVGLCWRPERSKFEVRFNDAHFRYVQGTQSRATREWTYNFLGTWEAVSGSKNP